jgi:hypothetical protein
MLDIAGGILIVLGLLFAVFIALTILTDKFSDKEGGVLILLGVVGFVVWLFFWR